MECRPFVCMENIKIFIARFFGMFISVKTMEFDRRWTEKKLFSWLWLLCDNTCVDSNMFTVPSTFPCKLWLAVDISGTNVWLNCIFRDLTLFKDKINTDLLSNWGFHYTAIKYHMLRYNVINLIPTVLPIFFFRCFAVLPICIVVSRYFWENTLIATLLQYRPR